MKRKNLKKNVKKAICLSMALAMATSELPGTNLFTYPKAIVKAADSTATVDSNAIVQQINDVNRPGIPDGVLLNELKRLVNTDLGRPATNDITFGELMAYKGEIDLSTVGPMITSISGLGYARKASKIILVNVPVTAIPDYEFDGCTGLQEIVLPNGITSIGKFAFRNCNKLTAIALPETVTSIGESAFDACVSLEAINIPNAVVNISKGAFGGCIGLQSMDITNPKVVLGASVFEGCTELKKVTLPEGITSIPASFFASSGIVEITVPTTVTEISQSAFNATYSLNSVDLSKCTMLKTIGTSAFAGSGLASIVLPNGLQSIKGNAFEASGLSEITIPDSVIGSGDETAEGGISHHAFWNCPMLEKVSLPAGVSKLPERVFSQCYALKSVEIRNSENSILESIEKYAFSECYQLENTDFLKPLKNLKSIGARAFGYYEEGSAWNKALNDILSKNEKDMYGENVYPAGLRSVTLPDCVTSFASTAFANQYNIEKIHLGDGISEIPGNAFSGMVRVSTVRFPQYLKKIGNGAFSGCYLMKQLQFPETLETIGENAFLNCGKVTKLEDIAYHYRYIPIAQIYEQRPIGNTTATECIVFDANLSYGNQIVEKVIDMEGALTDTEYKDAGKPAGYAKCAIVAQKRYIKPSLISRTNTGNTKYTAYVYDDKKQEISQVMALYSDDKDLISNTSVMPQEGCEGYYVRQSVYNRIHQNKFDGLEEVVLPNSVKEIGKNAFADCYNVKNITLSKQLETVAEGAFSISEPGLLKHINPLKGDTISGSYVFTKTVNFTSEIKQIEKKAFYNNINLLLPDGKLPELLESIGDSAFEQCKNITALIVPSKTEKIGKRAFFGCSEYKQLDKQIGGYKCYSLEENKGLQEIDLSQANALESIGEYAFALTPITQCTMPQKVKSVSTGVFQNCFYLKKVICSEKTGSIGDYAFSNCKTLVSITVPAKATISYKAFAGYQIGEFSFSVTDPEPISVSFEEVESLPINTFLQDYLRDNLVVTEKDGTTGFLEIVDTTKEKVNGLNVCRANVKGVSEGTTRISVVGTNNYETYDGYIISKAPEVVITVNVTKQKCEAIKDTTDRAVISIEDLTQQVQLSPQVLPADCTEQNVWSNGNDSVISVLPNTYVKDGVTLTSSSAIIVPKTLGTSQVTLQCGSVKKDYQVNVVVPAKEVLLKEEKISLKEGKGETIDLSATMTYDTTKYTPDMWDNYKDILIYQSGDEKIAKVSAEGIVTPVSAGITTVTVTALGSGVSTACTVMVLPDETMVYFTDEKGAMKEYDSPVTVQAKEPLKLNFATNPENSLNEITYEFSQETTKNMFSFVGSETKRIETEDKGIQDKVIAMSFSGNKIGTGTITILPKNYKNKDVVAASVTVNVIADTKEAVFAPVTKLVVGESTSVFGYLTSAVGKAENIKDIAKITTDQITFISSNPMVATVNVETGELVAVGEGRVNIDMQIVNPYNPMKNTIKTLELEITRPVATNVIVTEINNRTTVKIGDSLQLTTSLLPPEAGDTVIFESLTPDIATVDANGKITAIAAGAGRVKVTTSGKGVSKEFPFTVIVDPDKPIPTPILPQKPTQTQTPTQTEKPTQTVKVAKVSKITLKNIKGKIMKATWKKVSGASGYRIVYAKNNKFTKGKKVVTIKKNSTTTQIKKLKKGTTYYVKVQAYKTVNGKKVYGKYSSVKKIKIKK